MSLFFHQLRVFLIQFLWAEITSISRLLLPLFFALTSLILFYFALGNLDESAQIAAFIATTFLTALLALQLLLAQSIEPEIEDHALSIIKTYPIYPEAWFMSRFIICSGQALITVLCIMGFSIFLHQNPNLTLYHPGYLIIAVLVVLGLAALGTLLSLMLLQSQQKRILYPLLYFPLSVPVLLCSVEASMNLLTGQNSLTDLFSNWLGLLLIFDIIYIILGVLLFGELLKAE